MVVWLPVWDVVIRPLGFQLHPSETGTQSVIDCPHSRDWLVVLGPGDHSRGAGLHLADESGVLVQQDVHGFKDGDDPWC